VGQGGNFMRILVAEDEPDILTVYKHALRDRGHEVTISDDGDKCMKIYKQRLYEQYQQKDVTETNLTTKRFKMETATATIPPPSSTLATHEYSLYSSPQAPFDVAILDYKMPGKNGLEIAKEILSLVPRQRIVFASAYVKEALMTSVKELSQVVEMLQKPFTVELLIETIEDREPYEAIKNLMIDIRQQSKDLKDMGPETLKSILDNMRKIQKGRILQ
jgi:CheY-like chemotaxis protein